MVPMHSRLEIISKAFMEACWLATAAMLPLFFNISSVQIFEPDKMSVLKFLAIFSGAAWLLTQIAATKREGLEPSRSFLRKPLVKPVLALAAIYLLSSVFSIVPSLSWWGLYKRAQGTFSFFSYLVLFLIVITELRRPVQLKRLQFILILTSIPVAAYAILQQIGLDPLPVSRMFYGRSSGTMGNPIFLGGYLVMIIPLTICRIIEVIQRMVRDRERTPERVVVISCGVVLALQLAALVCTKSRGPVVGLVVAGYVCAFIFFVLNRASRKNGPMVPIAAAGLGLVAPLLVIAVARLLFKFPAGIVLAGLALAIAVGGIVYVLFYRSSWGRGWFWLTWLAQPLALVLVFAVFPANQILSLAPSTLGRFAQLSGGSIGVRTSLWESGVQHLQEGSPAVLPEGTRDPYHFLRRVIGYGPENSWLPANLHAVPSLLELQLTQTVDRMHCETFDNLLTLGFAGSAVFLMIVGAGLFYLLRLLGFDCQRGRKGLFWLLSALGVISGVLIPWISGASYFIGLGVELGLLAGSLVFIAWSGFRQTHVAFDNSPRQLFVLGLLGGLIAHVIETGVGIAITPTRAYFYLFLALVSVLSVRDFPYRETPAKARQSKSVPGLPDSLIPYALSAGFIVLALSWCFTFNSTSEQSTWMVFGRSWFSDGSGSFPRPCALLLVVLTIAGVLGLLFSEKANLLMAKSVFQKQIILSGMFLAGVWIVVGGVSAAFWTASGSSIPAEISSEAESRITLFLVALLLLLVAAAFVLFFWDREAAQKEVLPVRVSEWLLAIGLIACVAVGIYRLVLRPAWADSACRVAEFYQSSGDPVSAAQLFERASNFAPHEVAYRLSLGSVQSTFANSNSSQSANAEGSFRHALGLNPLDPVACRSLGTFHMQAAERFSDPALRAKEIGNALAYLKRAALLAPNFPDAYNEMGRCYFLLGDYENANRLYQKSGKISPGYSRTYMFIGEMHYLQKNYPEALRSFSGAAKLDANNVEAKENVGFLLALLGRRDEAIRANLDTLKIAPRDSMVLTRLAVLYFGQGDYGKGIEFARRAHEAMPASAKGSLDGFIEKLKNQKN
jgi:tetratricopeptide (TPR) repeat protein